LLFNFCLSSSDGFTRPHVLKFVKPRDRGDEVWCFATYLAIYNKNNEDSTSSFMVLGVDPDTKITVAEGLVASSGDPPYCLPTEPFDISAFAKTIKGLNSVLTAKQKSQWENTIDSLTHVQKSLLNPNCPFCQKCLVELNKSIQQIYPDDVVDLTISIAEEKEKKSLTEQRKRRDLFSSLRNHLTDKSNQMKHEKFTGLMTDPFPDWHKNITCEAPDSFAERKRERATVVIDGEKVPIADSEMFSSTTETLVRQRNMLEQLENIVKVILLLLKLIGEKIHPIFLG